jgi:hypothetical protein
MDMDILIFNDIVKIDFPFDGWMGPARIQIDVMLMMGGGS